MKPYASKVAKMKTVSGIDLERMLPHDKVSVKEIDGVMSKSMNEEVDLDEGKMKELHGYIEAGKSAEWIAKKMGVDVKTIKSLMSAYESNDGKYMEMLAAACGAASTSRPPGTGPAA